jgi:hypothetical protein
MPLDKSVMTRVILFKFDSFYNSYSSHFVIPIYFSAPSITSYAKYN